VTQEIKQRFDFCAEGLCPSCIKGLILRTKVRSYRPFNVVKEMVIRES